MAALQRLALRQETLMIPFPHAVRSRRTLRSAALLAAALLSAVPGRTAVAADAPATLRLSLSDAVGRALGDNAAAQLAGSEITRAEALAAEARSALLPQVNASVLEANQSINFETFGFVIPGTSPLIPPFNVVDGHVTAAMNVLQLSARKRLAAAKQGIVVARAERTETENQVASAVATLYVALLRARAQTATSAANVALAERLAASADRQLAAGTATRIDSTRAQVQLARQRDAAIAAQTAEDAARLALLRAVGAPLDAQLELADALLEQPHPAPSLDDALAAARATRPDLLTASERERAAELQLASAKAERLPTIGVQAQGGYSGNHANNLLWTRVVGATLNVPLYTGGAVPARIAEAETKVDEARIRKHDVERQAEQEVRYALLAYDAAHSRVDLAEKNRALAAEELEHAQDRFDSGVANALEVDNAQNSVTTAADTRVAALAAQAQAWFDVERATGRIRELVPAPATTTP
jgi:outer membrane protein TolC